MTPNGSPLVDPLTRIQNVMVSGRTRGWCSADGGRVEKTLVEVLDGGAVRSPDHAPDSAGDVWYDRTNLSPLPDGNVRQLIEVSRDGETWEPTFGAVYRRRGS